MSEVGATLRPAGDLGTWLDQRRTQGQADTRPEPGFFEGVAAQARLTQDASDEAQQGRLREGYDELMLALEERGLSRETFRRDHGAELRAAGLPSFLTPIDGGGLDYAQVWSAAQQAGIEGLPATQQEYERDLMNRRGGAAADMDTANRSGIVANLTGGVMGGMAESNLGPFQFIFGLGGRTIAQAALREGVVGLADEGINVAGRGDNMEALGREYTTGDAALDLGGAFVGSAGLSAAGQAMGRYVLPGVADAASRQLAPVRERFDRFTLGRRLAGALDQAELPEGLSPDQMALLEVAGREADIDGASPYARTVAGDAEFRDRLAETTAALEEGRPVPRREQPRVDFEQVKRAIRGPESGGDDGAVNGLGSSASGRYQFVQGTFVQYYRDVYGVSEAAARTAWRNRRFDPQVQERLMDALLADNARGLTAAGFEVTTGNLYIAHVMGRAGALKFLRERPDRAAAEVLPDDWVTQNPTYFGGGKTVAEAIAVMQRVVGDQSGAPVNVPGTRPQAVDDGLAAEEAAIEVARLRDDALAAELPGVLRPLIDDRSVSLNRPAELAAELGVTESQLRGALDRLVGTGELRLTRSGIYRRRAEEGPEDMLRFLASRGGLHPTGLGRRSREGGSFRGDRLQNTALNYFVPRRGPLLRENGMGVDEAGEALWDAGYFGPVETTPRPSENEVIAALEDSITSRIRRFSVLDDAPVNEAPKGRRGRFQSDEHRRWEESRWDLAGLRVFGRDLSEDEMFEAMDVLNALPDWQRIDGEIENDELDRVLTTVVSRRLDQVLEDAFLEVEDEIYDALEWQFAEAARNAAGRESAPGGTGGAGYAVDGGDPAAGGGSGGTGQGRALADELNTHVPDPDSPAFKAFDDPAGEGPRMAADSDWHDIRTATDGQMDFAAPSRDQARIALERQGEGRLAGQVAQRAPGSDGGLFDARATDVDIFDADGNPQLFDLGDGKGARTIADIDAEITDDMKAIEALRNCM